MASCLGLFVEKNLIKYAKVSKENTNIKIENFGIKFYDDPETTIKQIIDESFSYKIPISVNISNENNITSTIKNKFKNKSYKYILVKDKKNISDSVKDLVDNYGAELVEIDTMIYKYYF